MTYTGYLQQKQTNQQTVPSPIRQTLFLPQKINNQTLPYQKINNHNQTLPYQKINNHNQTLPYQKIISPTLLHQKMYQKKKATLRTSTLKPLPFITSQKSIIF